MLRRVLPIGLGIAFLAVLAFLAFAEVNDDHYRPVPETWLVTEESLDSKVAEIRADVQSLRAEQQRLQADFQGLRAENKSLRQQVQTLQENLQARMEKEETREGRAPEGGGAAGGRL
ncbi:MAG: hypothetical protein HYV61_08515 [Candidatus Rokubacteria bacterium]|nr:hypothetical protein [Candidatus Rokubacteria bacterium]